jgi:hypothetical protein
MGAPLIPTVQRVVQDTAIDATGQIKPLMRVQFMVGEHGPFTVSFPQSEFTADKARAAMQAQADQINSLLGGQ